MKKITYIILALLLSTSVFSQVEEPEEVEKQKKPKKERSDEIQTLFGNVDSHGGYGAITLNYSQINKKDALVIGGRMAWVIGHNMAVGLGGVGFFNDFTYDTVFNKNMNLQGGYGGFFMEPIIMAKFPVHLSFPLFLGVGGIAYVSDNNYLEDDNWENFVEESTAFVVVEPGVELELNMFKYFRLAFGTYYRYTSNIDLIDTKKDVLHGLSYGITLKLGKF
ncbi:MAG: hypothetical protein KAT68_14955 [Bacteroidales bacterium]|nr:hypothetical protein [Bacteroidales bacterium]